MTHIIASARVTLTIEVSADGTWGEDCKLDQVHKQAGENALGKMQKAFGMYGFKVIGEPTVISIMAEQKR